MYLIYQDSGAYTCTTQRGYSNGLQILVTNQICPKIELTKNVILNTTETFIGTQVLFTCPVGYNISGEETVLCRDDGE